MSSAKTIADILSFSELVDGKSFIGNPFTSQPMYIAACAFLMESIYYTSPSSRGNSPPPQALLTNQSSGFVMPGSQDRKTASKHTLLASAAKENYQRCYKALKALATYWEGTRYILTVLDQKAKGIVDPLLYTAEEMESAVEMPHVPSIAPPGWRMAGPSQGSADEQGPSEEMEASSDGNRMDRSQGKTSFGLIPQDKLFNQKFPSNRMGSHRSYQFFSAKSEPVVSIAGPACGCRLCQSHISFTV